MSIVLRFLLKLAYYLLEKTRLEERMTMADTPHSDSSTSWLTFFFVCFILTMSIGAFAIFTYKVNAPEPEPGGGGHHGMVLPEPDLPRFA